MNCAEYTELLQSYVDADLEEPSRGLMEAHGRHCFLCMEALEETRLLLNLLDTMEREPAPPDLAEAILRHLPRGPERPEASRPWALPDSSSHGALALVAGVAVVTLALLAGSLVSPSHWTAGLGTLATWWYGWVGDLVATGRWLRSSSLAELQQAAGTLLHAGELLLRAGMAPLLLLWVMTTLMGLCVGTPLRSSQRLGRSS